MFSPILAIKSVTAWATVFPASISASFKASIVFTLFVIAISANFFPNSLNSTFLATKSVSELNSINTALLWSADTASKINPSAAILPAFLTALAIPFSLK